jgi:hypothetical protein
MFRGGGRLIGAVAIGMGVLVAVPTAVAAVGPTCSATIATVPGPPAATSLLALDAVSSADVWAGGATPAVPVGSNALIEHWDGSSWSVSPSPTVPGVIYRIAHVSATDVWAVGRGAHQNVLAEHYDGTSWSVVPVPAPSGPVSILLGLGIRSAHDVWAVGFTSNPATGTDNAIMDHWDGTSWTTFPGAPVNVDLEDATVIPGGKIWLVGTAWPDTTAVTQNFSMFFDGTSWHTVTVPSPSATLNLLHGVTAISATDIWAVGFENEGPNPLAQSVHWDGTAWSAVPMLVPPGGKSRPRRVVALSSADVWAAGDGPTSALVEHWDGRAWSMLADPSANVTPFGIAALGQTDIWISGAGPNLDRLCPMRVGDNGDSLRSLTGQQGLPTAWHILRSATKPHSVTDASGLALFDSGPLPPGGSYSLSLAGSGRYAVSDSGSSFLASVVIPVAVSPASGTATASFTITAATVGLPSNLVEDIRIERPNVGGSKSWQSLTAITGYAATFTPDAGPGTYAFAARTRDPSPGGIALPFSPFVPITVTP